MEMIQNHTFHVLHNLSNAIRILHSTDQIMN